MTTTTRTRGLVLALCTAVISGVSVYVNAFAVKAVGDASVYTTAKNLVAALLLMGVVAALRVRARRLAAPLSPRQWAGLVVVAVVGGSVPFVLFFTGLASTHAPQAAFWQKTLVVWVAVLAVLVLRERLTVWHGLAIVLLVAGQWWLGGRAFLAWDTGVGLILAATLLWAIETVLVRRLLHDISSWTLATARMGLGGVLLLGWLALSGRLGALATLTPAMWGWVALTGVLLAAYVGTWYAALARAQAVDVTAILVLGAVVTALVDAGARGTVPSQLPALGVLVCGVALVVWAALRKSSEARLA